MTDLPARVGLRSNISFDEVWERIEMHEGKTFVTSAGKEFSYKVNKSSLTTTPKGYRVSRRGLEVGFTLCPLNSPVDIADKVMVSGLVFSILSDPRIRETDW